MVWEKDQGVPPADTMRSHTAAMSPPRPQTQSTKRPASSGASNVPATTRPRSWRLLSLASAAVAAAVVAVVALVALRDGSDSTTPASDSPVVGGDLHAVAVIHGRRFVSGHQGAAYSDSDGSWQSIDGLAGKDGMAWANVPGAVLVGGHEGLYVSTDGGSTFTAAQAELPVNDVHALGAAGETVYLASPEGGLFVSTDGAKTFDQRGEVGASFMGTMFVDPEDPQHVIAPDMSYGVVETRDGGATWQSLGGPRGVMSVALNPGNREEIVATGMGGSAVSDDAGQTWQPLEVPTGTAATTYGSHGELIAAVLSGTRAEIYSRVESGDPWTRV